MVSLLLLLLTITACGREAASGDGEPRGEVVLYCSADPGHLRPVVEAFEKQSGIDVRLVGDTEATKTTGLVHRLLAEKDAPRADVWWSSEAMGTVQLARAGVLEPYISESAEAAIREQGLGGWPAHLRGVDLTWYGFAQRARVFVVNVNRVNDAQAPRTIFGLGDATFRNRVGIARPQFGTTRSHVAAILARYGEETTRAWLRSLKDNGVRLYDGNMTVVRAVAQGEIDLGLTDTDDVWAGKRNGWPVEMYFEVPTPLPSGTSPGPLVIPNTVAVVRGGPNPEHARRLVDFLLSPEAERILARGESRNAPVNPAVAAEFPANSFPGAEPLRWEQIADHAEPAMRLVEEILGG